MFDETRATDKEYCERRREESIRSTKRQRAYEEYQREAGKGDFLFLEALNKIAVNLEQIYFKLDTICSVLRSQGEDE